jgi:hypothetical protein
VSDTFGGRKKETKNNNNNNNKKRCKHNKSPNFVWGLNKKKRSKHNMSPKLRLGDIIIFCFVFF